MVATGNTGAVKLLIALAALTSIVAALVACDPPVVIPPPGTGPGGGQFIIQCVDPVKVGTFDPIVYPGQEPAAHSHEFLGNRSINKDSTYDTMRQGSTACEHAGDTAGYWHPTLYSNGVRKVAPKSTFYYDVPDSYDGPVRTYPDGLKIISDRHDWGCGNGSGTSGVASPPQCSGDGRLTFHVTFPNCWNGTALDSADHRSHMAFSDGTRCPSSHPYGLPRLTMRIQFSNWQPNPSSLTLSSGATSTLHADFWNSWDPARLKAAVDGCLNAGRKCTADEVAAM